MVAAAVLRGQWYAVAASADLDDGPVGVRLLGEAYAVWRDGRGRIAAVPDSCPHRNAPLSLGTRNEDGTLECCYHGWTYDGDGTCVYIPSSGVGAAVPPKARLELINSVERYGLVWICPSDPQGDIPKLPEDDDPSFRRINNPVQIWKTSTTRMVDNFLDISHLPYVHLGTFGTDALREVPDVELQDLDDGYFGRDYEITVANPDVANVISGYTDSAVDRRMTTGFHLPFSVRSTIHYASGLEHIMLLLSTPIDDETSYFTFVVWRNDDFSVSAEEVIEFDRRIGAEDRAMLERIPGLLPLEGGSTVSVQADKVAVEWRRRLHRMLED